ncbi:60Kd inner membrane protein-domain-containing protein [Russula earlei]|uniref:60Kd inner membrane protein-domain-containing protein n=1 Tax=Russula earlei TaxID=71964 RepID=A0ACC0U9R9_9AGAM|nr:60Kd inner membrane protein-domain-containing protein [Russula earlei]
MLSRLRSVGTRSTRRYITPLTQLRSQRVDLLPCSSRVQAPLATRSIWLFSKKPEATTPTTVPRESAVPIPEPAPAPPQVATGSPVPPAALSAEPVPADAVAQASPLPPSDAALETLATFTSLQYGDLAALGLAGWSPAGLSTWMLELLNVSAGLPWFHTIVAGTLLSRLILLPFSIKQLRNSSALAPYQPRLLELKEELNRAYQSGDKLAVQRVALKQRRVYEESGVSMIPMMMMPFVQLPVTLGMFFGIKRLCALPVEQLHWSGVSFLPDLIVPDPYYVLPIASAVLMNLQLSAGAGDMVATADRATAANMINAFRIVSVISIPLMGHFPSGLNLYVFTGIAAMFVQTLVLRQDAVRRMLRIPVLPKSTDVEPVTLRESVDHIRQWFSEQNRIAQERAMKGKRW